ncbi:MAG: hypothetical protein V9G29_06865 [Burkholderiaceae bacterium]
MERAQPNLIRPVAHGTELVDVAVFPNERKAGAFASYYPEGLPQFFDEMETAISDARARHGVRVFKDGSLTFSSRQLRIATAPMLRGWTGLPNPTMCYFISAGNIAPHLWARSALPRTQPTPASANARNDALHTPAESARNVAVAALNPPVARRAHSLLAATRFSRRGPGMRANVKPDLAHVGGIEPSTRRGARPVFHFA